MLRKSVLATTIALFSFLMLGVLPGPIVVGDFNADGVVDGVDIKLAMDSCRRGFTTGMGGCRIQLEARTYSIATSLLWGDGSSNSDFQNGITIEGVAPCTLGVSPPYIGGGTVLKWEGADLGTVVRIDRATKGKLKNLCIIMDPDLVSTTGNEARYGILFDGSNSASKTTQGFVLEDVSIWGSIQGTRPPGMTGIYLTGTGTPKSAQQDKMVMERLWIDFVDIALKQDALQILVNRCRSCSLFGYSKGLELSGGDLTLEETIAGARNPVGGITYDMPHQNASGGLLVLEDSYWESGGMTSGTWMKIGQGYSSNNSTYGGYDVIIRGGYALNQCSPAPCNLTLIDGAVRHLIVDGLRINTIGTGNTWGVKTSHFNGTGSQVATVRWMPRIHHWDYATVMNPALTTSTVRWFAPVVGPGSTQVWNDVNTLLNYTLDAGEAAW